MRFSIPNPIQFHMERSTFIHKLPEAKQSPELVHERDLSAPGHSHPGAERLNYTTKYNPEPGPALEERRCAAAIPAADWHHGPGSAGQRAGWAGWASPWPPNPAQALACVHCSRRAELGPAARPGLAPAARLELALAARLASRADAAWRAGWPSSRPSRSRPSQRHMENAHGSVLRHQR